jgi:hypothetical protein
MQTALTFTRSHELYPTRWCDLFDLTSWAGEGWMLLDLPGAPCDVTQPQMRTMTQRLRKAQECAAAGGKYGLLQAVLLSLDSQPDCPAHWLREAIALEACSKVLLPAAHEAHVNLGAAWAAYQLLTPAEQRLWRQLQQARIQLKRTAHMVTVGVGMREQLQTRQRKTAETDCLLLDKRTLATPSCWRARECSTFLHAISEPMLRTHGCGWPLVSFLSGSYFKAMRFSERAACTSSHCLAPSPPPPTPPLSLALVWAWQTSPTCPTCWRL